MKATYKDASHYKYQLVRKFVYKTGIKVKKKISIPGFLELDIDGTMIFNIAYAHDGCTGVPDTIKNFIAGLLHDGFYQFMRANLFPFSRRDEVDKLFKKVLKEKGFMFPRLFYFGVKFLAKWAAKPKKEKIYTAP